MTFTKRYLSSMTAFLSPGRLAIQGKKITHDLEGEIRMKQRKKTGLSFVIRSVFTTVFSFVFVAAMSLPAAYSVPSPERSECIRGIIEAGDLCIATVTDSGTGVVATCKGVHEDCLQPPLFSNSTACDQACRPQEDMAVNLCNTVRSEGLQCCQGADEEEDQTMRQEKMDACVSAAQTDNAMIYDFTMTPSGVPIDDDGSDAATDGDTDTDNADAM